MRSLYLMSSVLLVMVFGLLCFLLFPNLIVGFFFLLLLVTCGSITLLCLLLMGFIGIALISFVRMSYTILMAVFGR